MRAIWSNTNPDSAFTYAYRNANPDPNLNANANGYIHGYGYSCSYSYSRTFNDSGAYSNADSFAYGYTNTNGDSRTYSNAECHLNPYSQAGDAGKHIDSATSRDRCQRNDRRLYCARKRSEEGAHTSGRSFPDTVRSSECAA